MTNPFTPWNADQTARYYFRISQSDHKRFDRLTGDASTFVVDETTGLPWMVAKLECGLRCRCDAIAFEPVQEAA